MKVAELRTNLETIIKSLFPDSYFHTEISSLGGSHRPSVIGHFALGKDKTEWNHGIIHNDPAHTIFLIHCLVEDEEIVFCELASSLHGIRDKDRKFNKLGWRNINKLTSPEKILNPIVKYFTNMKEELSK